MKKIINYNDKEIKNKGFTLIELLAVIVILAVIALIATPIVLSILTKVRKSAFQDSAYGLMESAKAEYLETILDGEEKPTLFEYPFDHLKFSGTKPKGGMIVIDKDGYIAIAIHNNIWCAIKGMEDTKVKIIDYNEETCKIAAPMITEGVSVEELKTGLDSAIPGNYFNIKNAKGSVSCYNLSDEEKEVTNTKDLKEGENEIECRMMKDGNIITSLKRTFKIVRTATTIEEIIKNNAEVVALDPDINPRFVGANPNNYVTFGNDLYRIIGVFNNQMKIIYWGTKENPGMFYNNATVPFDPNASNGGHGDYGYNDWNQAKLQKTLNTTYWDTIPVAAQAMVDKNHIWNIGGAIPNITRSEYYTAERSSTISSTMTSSTWTGKVGLMYPSDYGYATNSTNGACESISMDYWHINEEAKIYCSGSNYNWLVNVDNNQWTMTAVSNTAANMATMAKVGTIGSGSAAGSNNARPVLYLNSNVKISGKGTVEEPFELSL